MSQNLNSTIKDYWPLLARVGLIVIIPLFVYLWGTAIIYNLANFWNIVAPAKANQFPAGSSPLIMTPVLSTLPAAVKEEKLSISGFAQEGVEVELFVNGQAVAKARSGKKGEFSFEDIKLLEGENQIFAKALSQKTESYPSAIQTVEYLKKPPFLEVSNLPEQTDLHQKENLFTLRGLTDPGALVAVNGSQAFVDGNGNFSFAYPLLEGENKITIQATDKAGNQTALEKKINYFRE